MNKVSFARQLRKKSTIEERRLWNLLKNKQFHNLKFRRQHPIGKYVADFVCEELMLIIELDGGQHNTDEIIEKDNARSEYLRLQGYKVIRFWNNDVYKNIEGIISEIEKYITN